MGWNGNSRSSSGASYAHVGERWAARNEEGVSCDYASSPRVVFRGTALVSYKTVVACYRTNSKGQKFVLASSRKYSQSTTRHINNCTAWCQVPVFHVEDVEGP